MVEPGVEVRERRVVIEISGWVPRVKPEETAHLNAGTPSLEEAYVFLCNANRYHPSAHLSRND